MLLIHNTRPEECFITFCNLVLSPKYDFIYDCYTANHTGVLKIYKVFWRLAKEQTPLIYSNLKENDATCRMFLFEWIITMCAVLWDQILYYGQHHILRIAIAICQVIEKKYKNELWSEDDPIDV